MQQFPVIPRLARQAWPDEHHKYLTGQGASIPSTVLAIGGPPGLFRICVYLATHTAGTGNVSVAVGWTDDVGAKVLALPNALSFNADEVSQDSALIQVASGSITFSTTYTSSGKYNIIIALERLI